MEKTFNIDYITSDTHFYHKNIVKYCNRPQNHDEIMIEGWQQTVGKNDRVYHLGDFALAKPDEIKAIADKLPGYKILLLGNHDRRSVQWYLENGFDEVYQKPITVVRNNVTVVMSHRPIDKPDLWGYRQPGTTRVINIHGHVHNNGYENSVDGVHLNVSVEMTEYRPIPLDEAIDTVLKY